MLNTAKENIIEQTDFGPHVHRKNGEKIKRLDRGKRRNLWLDEAWLLVDV